MTGPGRTTLYACPVFCNVVLLRAAGKKLPHAALPAPVRGELSLTVDWAAPPFRPDLRARVPIAVLAGDVYLRLYDARIRRIDGESMVLVGGEEADGEWTPQAWWCRLVDSQEGSLSEP